MTRRRAIIGGVALAVLLATFAAGRYSRSPRVVTVDKTKIETVTVEKVRTVTVHDVVQAKAVEAKVRTVVVTKTRWLPGGPVETETTTTKQADTDTHETKQAHATGTQEQQASMQQTIVETHTSSPAGARWSFSLMPGAQLFGTKAVTLYGPLVIGASVERRFIGPVSLGIWGSTSGSVGISWRGDL